MGGVWYQEFKLCSCGCGAAVVEAPDTRIYQLHSCYAPNIGADSLPSHITVIEDGEPLQLWQPGEVPS